MAEPTLAEIIAAVQAGGAQDPNAPIGVPSGYVPPIRRTGPGAGFQPGAGPAIAVGDLRPEPYRPGDDLLTGVGVERIVDIQQSLIDAGLLRGSFQAGVWDTPSRNAYRTLLGYANQLGTTDDFALRHWMANSMGEVDTTPPAPRQAFVAEVANPDDIRAILRETFRERLGYGKIDDARLDAMVKAYQGEQVATQRQQYDMTGAGAAGGTVVEPPSLSAFADIQAKALDPTAYDSRKVVAAAEVMERVLGGQT